MTNLHKAVFFDRDGVINKERKDYVKTPSELKIFPRIVEPIKKLREAGFVVVVITNQSAINRGLTTCLLYTSPSPRDRTRSRMPSSA